MSSTIYEFKLLDCTIRNSVIQREIDAQRKNVVCQISIEISDVLSRTRGGPEKLKTQRGPEDLKGARTRTAR
jgi:hypothetical protein